MDDVDCRITSLVLNKILTRIPLHYYVIIAWLQRNREICVRSVLVMLKPGLQKNNCLTRPYQSFATAKSYNWVFVISSWHNDMDARSRNSKGNKLI